MTPRKRTSSETDERLARLEAQLGSLVKLFETRIDGTHQPIPVSRPSRAPAARHPLVPGPIGDQISALPDKEPRRQRKQRNMPERKVYSALPVNTVKRMEALRTLTEGSAAIAILKYVATHPRSTVRTLVAALDLTKSTVDNNLSVLSKQKNLIQVDDAK